MITRALPTTGPRHIPVLANRLNSANASAFRSPAASATYARTAGLNRAPATPLTTDAATSRGRLGVSANSPNPKARSRHPVMMTPRGPSRSEAVPPIRNRPCWARLRTPRTTPIAASDIPAEASRCTAR